MVERAEAVALEQGPPMKGGSAALGGGSVDQDDAHFVDDLF